MSDINNEISTLENIIIKMPVYKEYKFKIIKDENGLKIDDLGATFFDAMFNTNKCDLLCVECNKVYPFDVVNEVCIFSDGKLKYIDGNSLVIGYSVGIMGCTNRMFKDLPNSNLEELYVNRGIIEQYLYCNKFPHNHIYVVYYKFRITKDNISIMKIGQDVPSFMLTNNLSNIYKKELSAYNAFDDFRMYEQSMSRELRAGACTYLRRVLEKIVITKYIKKNGQNDTIHFEYKIKDVIDEFDEDIRDVLKNTYGLLSKGIHELDENDIDNFISNASEVIIFQLEYEKTMRETKERKKALKSQININASKYNN